MRSKRHEHGQDVTRGQKQFIRGLPVGEKIKESLVMLFQLLLSVQRGSKLLSGSSPSGGPCRPLPSCGRRKLCLLIRCLPRWALSIVKASGVREASRSKDEEVGGEGA